MLFLDGVGLGDANSEANPFMNARMETLDRLLGVAQPSREAAGTMTERAALLGLDACLGVPGLPQSATGQTSILTGQNAPAVLGEHYGPYPNQALQTLLAHHSLFKTLQEAGQPVAYANAYPDRFLERIKRGKGRLSANTQAALLAGLKLRGREDLQQGRAIAALLGNDFWPEPEVYLPPLNAYQAGLQLAALAGEHRLTFFEFWYSDFLGHKQERAESLEIIRRLDEFLGGIIAGLDLDRSLLVVVSDHGNFEDWTTRKHTTNPALAVLVGQDVPRLATQLHALTDIKPVIMSYLLD
jgi:hypothetical protein